MSPRGGKRDGSGRKSLGPSPGKTTTINLSPEELAELREIGGGFVSQGVRLVLRYYRERHADVR